MAEINRSAGGIAQFLLPQIQGQFGDLDLLQPVRIVWSDVLMMDVIGPIIANNLLRSNKLYPADPACGVIPQRWQSRLRNNFRPLEPDSKTAGRLLPTNPPRMISKGRVWVGRDRMDGGELVYPGARVGAKPRQPPPGCMHLHRNQMRRLRESCPQDGLGLVE